jgi:hypothetical protein
LLPWAGAISSVDTRQDRGGTGLMPTQPEPFGSDFSSTDQHEERTMNNIFSIIGVVVVVLVILGYFGFR